MATTDKDVVEAQAKQRSASKRATLTGLKKKQQQTKEIPIYIDGEEQVLVYKAIGAREYDRLVSKHPPKSDQRAEGAQFNIDTFAPALISAVCIAPEMTFEEAKEIWDSPDWSRGDLMYLWSSAVDLCNQGLNVPFSETA